MFVAQKSYVPFYERDLTRQSVHWLPLCCDPASDRMTGARKIHEVCFVGTLDPHLNPRRVQLIEELQKYLPLYVTTGDYVPVFNASKIVLNQSVKNDVNYRTFQAMACGSLLLTERVGNGLDDLFRDRRDLLLYEKDQVQEIIDLVRYYGAHDAEREAMAAEGRRVVLNAHTVTHRAQTILANLSLGNADRRVLLRKSHLAKICLLLKAVYQFAADASGLMRTASLLTSEADRQLQGMQEKYASMSTLVGKYASR